MYALRHKTSKRLFLVKYWLMAAIYISALFLLGYAMIQQMRLLQCPPACAYRSIIPASHSGLSIPLNKLFPQKW